MRSHWLAEKILSGELPAATGEMESRCDAFFVEQDRAEDHARFLAACLVAAANEQPADTERRLRALSTYLHRLLSVREMWARERS